MKNRWQPLAAHHRCERRGGRSPCGNRVKTRAECLGHRRRRVERDARIETSVGTRRFTNEQGERERRRGVDVVFGCCRGVPTRRTGQRQPTSGRTRRKCQAIDRAVRHAVFVEPRQSVEHAADCMRDIELVDRRRELEWSWVDQLHPTVESHALEGGDRCATGYRLNAADALAVKTTLEHHQIARGRIASAPHVRFHIEYVYVESRHTAHNLRPCNRRGQYFQRFVVPNVRRSAREA